MLLSLQVLERKTSKVQFGERILFKFSVDQEFCHFGPSNVEIADLEEIPGWVSLLADHIHAGGGDEHGVQVLATESHRRDLLHGERNLRDDLAVGRVDLEDAAAAEHRHVQVAIVIDGQAIWDVGLDGSVAGDVGQNLLVRDVAGLNVIHELLDVQVVRVDEVESVELVVEGDSVGESNLGLQLDQTLMHCVAVQRSDALNNQNVNRHECRKSHHNLPSGSRRHFRSLR